MTDTYNCECQCGKAGCASRRVQAQHGTTWTYDAGCRCDECREVHTRKTLKQRSATNARTLEGARHHYQEWTGAELEIVTRPGLTAREAGELIGRTMQAVKNARWKCENDPKYIAKLGAKETP